jgi:predicted  nucleic acid-binding Zn-ribbon protein
VLGLSKLHLIGAGAVLLALALAGWQWTERIKAQGRMEQAQDDVKATRALYEKADKTLGDTLTAQREMQVEFAKLAADLTAAADRAGARADAASRAALADRRRVEVIPDLQVLPELERAAGGPITEFPVQRRILATLVDYPHQIEQVAALTEERGALRQAGEAKEKELAAIEKQRDAAMRGYEVVRQLYVTSYNALQQPKRRAWCLWLCKTRPRLIPLPDPSALPASQ